MNSRSLSISSILNPFSSSRGATTLPLAVGIMFVGLSVGHAQTARTWSTLPSDGNWSNVADWSGGVVPVTGDRIAFGTSSITTLNNDLSGLTLNATSTAAAGSALYFASGASAYTFNGNTLALTNQTGAGGSVLIRNDSTSTETFGLNLNLSASSGQPAEISTSGDLVFNGTIGIPTGSDLMVSMGSSTSRTVTFNGAVTLTNSNLKGLVFGGNSTNPGGVYTFNNTIACAKISTGTLPVTINSGTVNLNAVTTLTGTGARTLNLLTNSSANPTGAALNINNFDAFEEFNTINILQTAAAVATVGSSGTASILVGANGWSTSAAINIGTNQNSGASIILGGKTGLGTNGTATFSGDITALDSTNDRARTLTLTAAEGRVNFNGVISTASGGATVLGVTKTGAGIVSLAGANTYTGGTTISAGTLTAGISNAGSTSGAFGATNGTTGLVTLGNAATTTNNSSPTLLINAAGITVSNPITVANQATSGVYIIGGGNTSGTATYTGNITLNKAVTLQGATGGTIAFSTGTWVTNNNAFTIGSSGNTGTVELDNAVATSGGVSVNNGTLKLGNTLSVTGGTLAVATAGTLSSNSSGTVTGNATLTGNGVINLNSASAIGGTLGVTGGNWNGAGSVTGVTTSSSGNFNIGSGANLTASSGLVVSGTGAISSTDATGTITGSVNYTSGTNSSFSGVIAGSGKSLTMNSGSATLALSGTNTYTGATTVSAGNLQVNGALASGSAVNVSGSSSVLNGSGTTGAVTVSSGGTVGGTLHTGALTVQSGGIVSPGNSPGILSSNGATFLTGGSYVLQVNNDGSTGTPGTNWDQLALTGSLDISSLTSSSTFTLTLQSLTALNVAGSLASFNESTDHTWASVITTTTGFSGAFNSNLFMINSVDFTNPFTGTFSLAQNGFNVDLIYTAVVPEPSTWALMIGGFALLVVIQRRKTGPV